MGQGTAVRVRTYVTLVATIAATLVAVLAPPPAHAAAFTFEAVAADATFGTSAPAISADGRFVAFDTLAALTGDDTNGRRDVYLRELATGTTTRVSVQSSGASFPGHAFGARVSGDGGRVAFSVDSIEGGADAYLRDVVSSTTVRVNQTPSLLIGGTSVVDDISDDGSAVVWTTDREVGDFVAGMADGNGATDVILTTFGEALAVTHQLVSLDEDGNGTNTAASWDGSLNGDATGVAFLSLGTEYLPGVMNSLEDVWVWNGMRSFPVTGVAAAGSWENRSPVMLADGRVLFVSEEPLVADDTNRTADVYAWSPDDNSWTRLVMGFEDQLYEDVVTVNAAADGSTLVFDTTDTTVLDGVVVEPTQQVYRLDLVTDEVELVPVGVDGTPHEMVGATRAHHTGPVLSDSGTVIAFVSPDELAPGDTNGQLDVVVATRSTVVPPAPTPTLGATTPTTGLVPGGDTVTVEGNGFSAGGTVSVRQCADVDGVLTCTTGAVEATADSVGAFAVDVPVSRTTSAFSDCPDGGCVIRAHDGAGHGPEEHTDWVNDWTGGVATGPSLCPDGSAVTGLDVATDHIGGTLSGAKHVARLAVVCGALTGAFLGQPSDADGAVTEAATTTCPSSGVVTGITGRVGDLIDSIVIQCRTTDAQDVPTGAVEAGPLVGGSGGPDPYDVSCPVGTAAVGVDGARIPHFAFALQSIRLVCADVGGSGVDISFASVPTEPRDLSGVTLTTSAGGEVPAGLDMIPIVDIPVESIPFANVAIGATPLKSIDLAAAPLKSIPLKSIPLKSIPLKSITLSQLPLELPGGWAARLVGTSLEGLPLQTVTLAQVADEPASTDAAGTLLPHPLDGIDLSEVGIASSPLKSIGLASIALGSTPLKSIPLKSIDTTQADPATHVCPLVDGPAPTDSTAIVSNWETLLACLGFPTTVGTDTTLMDVDIAGAPLKSIPLKSIPLKSIDLAASPLKSIPLKSIELAATPLKSIPLKSIVLDVQASPLKSIPLKSIPLKSIGDVEASPLKSIPLKSIPLKSIVVDCDDTRVECDDPTSAQTLGDVAAIDPNLVTGTLGDLGDALTGFTLGDLMGETGSATIGDAQAWLVATGNESVTLVDLLVGLLLRTDYPWEELPVADMRLQNVAPTAERVTASLSFVTNGAPNAGEHAVVAVTLPPGAAYEPGSTLLETTTYSDAPGGALGFTTLATTDPSVSGNVLTWTVGSGTLDDTTVELAFAYRPGVRLVEEDVTAVVNVGPVGGDPSATATVTSATYAVGERARSDDDPATAPLLANGTTLVVGHVAEAGDVDHYRIPAAAVAGKRVSIDLAVAGVDQDLVLYSPVESASVIDATPLKSIPLKSIAVEDEGVVRPGEVVPPETLQDIPLKSIPLKSISANRDATDESIDVLADEETTGHYTIQVSGYNGAISTEPYVLRMRVTDPAAELQCPDTRQLPHTLSPPTTATTAAAPQGTEALYVVNPSRIDATYGLGTGAQVVAALERLETEAGVDGHVLAVDGDADVRAAYAAWDAAPCSPSAANVVVEEIVRLVEASHANAQATIPHVVLVGGDDVLPQGRIPDLTRLSNERDYLQDVGLDNPLAGAFATEHLLSDDPYGDRDPIPWLNRFMYVPDTALGRLVETPAEIVAAIDRFIAWDGSLDPSTAAGPVTQDALVTGYDFLADGAHAVAGALEEALPANTPVDRSLVSETWTRQDLVDNLLLAESLPYVAAVNAHFDHHRSLPGAGNASNVEDDLFTTADVADPDGDPQTDAPSLDQRLLFSMGCHSGLNVPDVYVQGIEDGDWAQTFAQQGAGGYVANTGFGYGDTATVALSERLMAEFASRLDGTMTVGQAMTYAKQAYAGQLGLYGAYDEKVLAEATFYGLPMFHISDQPGAPADLPEVQTAPVAGAAGVTASTFALDSTALATQEHTAPDGSTFLTVGDELPQVTSGRPITPRTDRDVTPATGPQARGVLLTGLTSTEAPVQLASFARAVVDHSSREPAIPADVAFPASFASVNRYRDPLGERSQLVLLPGQFVPDDDPATFGAGTQRRFTQMAGTVFYSDDPDVTPPSFSTTSARANASTVTFEVDVADVGNTVMRVLVLYRDTAGAWKSAELADDGSGTWTGSGPVATEEVEYMVQAVDVAGNVASTTNKGFLFAAAADAVPPVVTISSPTEPIHLVGDEVTIGFACEDANLVDCTATLNGVPVLDGHTVDTTEPNPTNVLEVTGVDAYGNTTPTAVTFAVGYAFGGFAEPLASGNRIEVKAGSAVPVRWQLLDRDGPVSDRAAIADIRSYDLVCGATAAATSTLETTAEISGLTYDHETGQWQYVWKTDRTWRSSCRQLVITFWDGQTASAVFTMK